MPNMRTRYQQWKLNYPEVIFPGRIEDAEVPLFYRAADLFVTYSYAGEGFGLTLAEAMACGTPVVCSALPAYQEVVDKFGTLVPPQQPQQLADAMSTLLTNQEELQSRRTKGAQYIQTRFSWEKSAKAHLKVYEQAYQNIQD